MKLRVVALILALAMLFFGPLTARIGGQVPGKTGKSALVVRNEWQSALVFLVRDANRKLVLVHRCERIGGDCVNIERKNAKPEVWRLWERRCEDKKWCAPASKSARHP